MQTRYLPFSATSRCGFVEWLGAIKINDSCVGACNEETESMGILIIGERICIPAESDSVNEEGDHVVIETL